MRSTQRPKRVDEVFGVSNQVLQDSYVDRGALDEQIRTLLARPNHIALRGASKCGKSWLRQTVLPNAIVLQCRHGKTVLDIYREALAQLDVRLELSSSSTTKLEGRVEASTEAGISLIAKAKAKFSGSAEVSRETAVTSTSLAHDISDLRFVAEILIESRRRLVVEDFHYLSVAERKTFAFDLKALWDFGVFVVVVGVWSDQNLLLYLNPDLSGRVEEVSIVWAESDLRKIFERGGSALGLTFSTEFVRRAIDDCYENAGILQKLILLALDEAKITQSGLGQQVGSLDWLNSASLLYAEQLNPLYQQFAGRVSKGIRTRQNSTGIYAHAMAAILGASDESLVRGLSLGQIFRQASARESRIQQGNLRTVLEKIEGLQVDEDGRGLVLAYNEIDAVITAVDRQLLFYRKYSTVSWPWEDLIADATRSGESFEP